MAPKSGFSPAPADFCCGWVKSPIYVLIWNFFTFPKYKNKKNCHCFWCLLAFYLLPPWSPEKGCNLKSDNSTLRPKYIFFFYLNPAFMPNISLVSGLFLFLKMMRNINFTKYWNPKISFSFKSRFFVMLNNHVGSWFSCMFLNLWSSVLQYGSFWYFMVVCTGQYGPVRSFVVLCGQVPFSSVWSCMVLHSHV